MKTSLMQKGKTGVKKSLIITLIMVMIITMIPANTFAYTGYPCETDKASAELYPFPVEMKVFSQYLYGSENNLTGKVKSNYCELLRLIEVGASCFNHYCVGCGVTQLNVLHNVHRRISLG